MRKHLRLGVLSFSACIAVTAGCGGESDDEATATTEAGTGGNSAPAGVDRSGETIKIGYVNNEGGVISLPAFRVGGEVAVEAVNDAGGVNGASVELVMCLSDGSPEGSIDCANQLIDADVVLAYAGLDIASDAALPLYQEAGIPYVSSNAWGTAQADADGSFILHAPSAAYVVGPFLLMQDLGLSKLAAVYQMAPAIEEAIQSNAVPIADSMGIDVEFIPVDPAAPDWTSAIAVAESTGADMIWGQLTEADCIGLVTAARTGGYDGTLFPGSCSVYVSVLGADAVGTYTQSDIYAPSTAEFAPPEIADRLADYVEEMQAAGHEDALDFGSAPYSAIREVAIILASIEGAITAESVTEAFSAGETSEGWFGPDLQCGAEPWPTSRSHCTSQVVLWQIEAQEDGSVRRVLVKDFYDAFSASGL